MILPAVLNKDAPVALALIELPAPGGRTQAMTNDSHAEAALALHRFGFGPRAGSIAAIARDPRGALLAELERPGAARVSEKGLLSSQQAIRAVFEFRQERAAKAK